MAQRLPRVEIFADLGERHRDADVGQLLERAPRAAVGPDILALDCRLDAARFGGEQAVEGFLIGGGGAQARFHQGGLARGDRGARGPIISGGALFAVRSEEQPSELQSLMSISHDDSCSIKTKNNTTE